MVRCIVLVMAHRVRVIGLLAVVALAGCSKDDDKSTQEVDPSRYRELAAQAADEADDVPLPPARKMRAPSPKLDDATAEPFMPKTREKQSGIRQKLARAGIYSASAIRVMTGAKVIFTTAGLGFGYPLGIFFDNIVLGIAIGGLLGYMVPALWLKLHMA